MLDALRHDLRYTVRGLAKRPGFAVAVILTLALGIGANAAMFSIVDRLLFRPPPLLHHASRVHRIYTATTYRGQEYTGGGVPYALYVDLTRDTRSFVRTAEFTAHEMAIGVGEAARQMTVGAVSASFFGFFEAPPAAGRYFTPAEDRPPAGTPVAVLSYGLWQTRYGGRPDVVGRTVQIGPERYTVVGVAPRGFRGVWPETPPAAYIPITTYGSQIAPAFVGTSQWWSTYGLRFASMLAERKPGVTIAATNADLTRAFRRSYEAAVAAGQRSTPVGVARPHAMVASVLLDRGPNASSVSRVALWIGGVALVVWLLACANVANLLLARALRRRREVAVRLALGVSRSRLAAQLLTETLVLGVLGGAVGLAVAQWGGTVLRSSFLSDTAHAAVLTDPRTLAFAGVTAVVAGLLTGLAPLLQARHTDLTRDLREGVREGTYRRSRLRSGLLVLQAALCAVLLVGAGLFVRSLRHVRAVPLGFEPAHVLQVDLNMRGVKLDSAATIGLLDRLRARAAALPEVSYVSRQVTTPFWSDWSADLHVAGIDSVSRLGDFELNAVSSDYFATMGTRLLEGRGIGPEDVAGAPRVMVVSQAMAGRLWPGKDPLGRCVRVGADTAPCTYVVGVAENVKTSSLSDDPGLGYYLSSAQFHPRRGGLFVRVRGDAAAAKETVRAALQRLMPGAAYVAVTPLSDFIGQRTRSWRLGALLFALFGFLALALAAIGLYAVVAFDVRQRRHELGVRVALGATMRDIAGQVLGGGLKLAATGIALGLAIALLAGRWIGPLLFEESPRDPTVLVAVAMVLLGIAALASFIPARRAARVDPMEALRHE